MQYMALIYGDQNRWASFSDEERSAAYALYRAFGEEAAAAGVPVAPRGPPCTPRARPAAPLGKFRRRDTRTLPRLHAATTSSG